MKEKSNAKGHPICQKRIRYIYIYIYRLARKLRILSPFAFSCSSISFTPLIVILGLGLFGFTTLSSVLFSSPSAHAENVRYDVNINSSLTLGFSSNTVSLNLNPGSKTFDSQDITTTVSTNNQYGYDLYVTSNGTDLINQTDNTYTIPTLPAKEGGYDVDTFLADKWGVMMNNTSYEPFVSGTTVSQSNTVTNADNTILTFGAKTSYNTAPGNYKLALNFQLVARVATNDLTINFAGEGVESVKVCTVAGDCTGDDLVGIVTTSGNSVPGLKDGSSYYLYPVFTDNYEFVSWEKTSEAGTISATDILNPTFTMADEPASVTITGKQSKIYIQDFTATMCSEQASSDAVTVYDKRDENSYTVRYINNNCWMTQNLRFSGSTIDSTNTNINTSKTISWSDLTSGNSYDDARYHDSGNTTNGYWYNYAGASAMTITGSSDSTNATYDICPKNWRLPTLNEFSGITSQATAFSPVTGGHYISGSIDLTGSGFWWSATTYGSASRYALRWHGSSLGTGDDTRLDGFYVRCIRKSIDDATYMQDVTTEMVTNTAEGATAILRDSRDNQDYTVAKINGNLWMTRNLAIGCNGTGSTYGSAVSSKPLTADDSNIANTSDNPWNTPTTSLTAGNSYDDPRIACSSTYGAWYNYAATSAGTITGSSNQNTQTYDICPKNWRLPTDSEQSGITSSSSAFSPVAGGRYDGGSINGTEAGRWWSATAVNSTNRYGLDWNGSSLNTVYNVRNLGFYVRCIRSS